jgi:putative pyoverdin transport system ATP-binding/permease protein
MKLFAVLRRYAPLPIVLGATLLGAISGLASTGLLIVINQTLSNDPIPREVQLQRFFGLIVLVAISRFFSSTVLVALGARAANVLQVNLARRILSAPLRRLEEVGSHRLLASLLDDVGVVSGTMTILPNGFINIIVVTGSLCYLGWLSIPMLGGVMIGMLVGVVTYRLAVKAGSRRQRRARELEDELFFSLRGLTEGTKELKMRRSRGEEFIRQLEAVAVGFRAFRVSAQKIFIAAGTWGNLLFFVVIGMTLYFVPTFIPLSIQARNGYVLILLYMMGPLQAVLNAFPDLSQAEVAIRKIEQLGISLLDDAEPEGRPVVDPGWRRIELAGATHTYRQEEDDMRFTLGPVNLALHPGEMLFVIGGNGSGKTTLVKMLIGLYQPESGELRLDGETVSGGGLEEYRQRFAVVFSDFFLFEKLFGLDSPELDTQARHYLAELRLKHKVRIEGGRLSTTDLSQGQRKRLALLTAYLEDAPIFVFDEWAADQDPEFKQVFYYELLPELKARGKTIIVISHDDRYYHVGDRVIKLESGQIVYDKPVAQTQYATA